MCFANKSSRLGNFVEISNQHLASFGVGFRCGTLSTSPVTDSNTTDTGCYCPAVPQSLLMSGLPLPQASGIDEGEGARGASDPHVLPPGEGQAV